MRTFKTVCLGTVIALFLSAPALAGGFTLSSGEITNGGKIAEPQTLSGFGCTGANISPSLSWKGAPSGTKSFALTMYDPDAPTGSGFWHWLVVNIPANATALPTGAGKPDAQPLPEGALQTRTDFGAPGYGGPCPPKGDKPHRYQFTLFALDVEKLPVDADASGAVVGFNLHFHTLGKATLTATYGR